MPVPESVQKLRQQFADRAIYGGEQYRLNIPDNMLDDAPEAASLDPAIRKAAIAETREMAADLGLTSEDVAELKSLAATVKEPPSAEQRAAWVAESTEALKREYGEQWQDALRDAMRLVNRDPRVAQVLLHNNRGDHPRYVMLFAKLAELHAQGLGRRRIAQALACNESSIAALLAALKGARTVEKGQCNAA